MRYTYDAAGRLTSRTWARGVRTIYAYDPATGDLKSISYSDGTPGVSFTTRDRLGRIDTLTDAIGAQNLDFDAEGTLTSHAYTDGALAGIALTIGKDGLGRRSGLSVTRNGNTIHSVAEGYDQFGRLSTHSFGGRTVTYGYDPARGLRTETRFPSGVTTTTAYDSAGRISSVLSAKNGQVLAGRTYPVIDKANRRKQIGEPDGSSWTHDYNPRGEVIRGEKRSPAGNLLDGHRFTYQYDHIGNRITATTGAPDLVASYATNALNQYTQITTPQTDFVRGAAQGATSVTVRGQAVALGPDGSFNARVTGSGPATIVATAANSSTSTETRTVALPPATFAPTYDADGNLLNDGLWTYTWDGENRLIALESTPTNPIPERIFKRFTYDYQSRRVSEERFVFDPVAGTGGAGAYVLEKAIRWVNDGWNQSVELLNDRPIRAYVWGGDLSGTRDGAGGVGGLLSSVDLLDGSGWDYFFDGNGNVVTLADATTGAVVGSYDYEPFGEEVGSDGLAARVNRFRFSSKMTDIGTGLAYYGLRYYCPATGTWLSRDLIGEQGCPNLYGFVGNSPVGRIDWLGLRDLSPDERKVAHELMLFAIDAKLAGNTELSNAVTDVKEDYMNMIKELPGAGNPVRIQAVTAALSIWANPQQSKSYSFKAGLRGLIGEGSPKCNKYVADVFAKAGVQIRITPHDSSSPRPPIAGEYNNLLSDIQVGNAGRLRVVWEIKPKVGNVSGTPIITFDTPLHGEVWARSPTLGDVVSFGHPSVIGGDGHVGITLGHGIYISARHDGVEIKGEAEMERRIYRSPD